MTTSSPSSATCIPPPGEETSFPLHFDGRNDETPTLVLRHGSSLALITQVCTFLANPMQNDAFNYIDPTADHHKWARKGMKLYYACVVDAEGAILCALRAATEGMDRTNDDKKNKTFLIDYVYTALPSREKGIAGLLIAQVLEMALSSNATCYVLSLEESAVYWMEKHSFYLVQSPALNARFNLFPDTHLLRRGNPSDSDDQDDALSASDEHTDTSNDNGQLAFTSALEKLVAKESQKSEGMKLCLHSLSLLLKNALQDDSDDGRRRRVRINNPNVHRRIFAVGGEDAMNVLVACDFELGTDEEGDAILQFHRVESNMPWLLSAVQQLEKEAKG